MKLYINNARDLVLYVARFDCYQWNSKGLYHGGLAKVASVWLHAVSTQT